MEVKIRKGILTIALPLEEPRRSASGKTMVVASSRGVRKTNIRIGQQLMSVVANAFISNELSPRPPQTLTNVNKRRRERNPAKAGKSTKKQRKVKKRQ